MSLQIVPELPVDNVARSIAFYSKLFDFEVAGVAPEDGAPTWAELTRDHSLLMLQQRALMEEEIPALVQRPAGSVVLVLRVTREEARRIYDNATATGQSVVMALRDTDYGTTEFGVEDPDGFVVIIAGR